MLAEAQSASECRLRWHQLCVRLPVRCNEQDMEAALLAALAATLKIDKATRRRSTASNAATVLQSAVAAEQRGRRTSGGRRSRSHAGEVTQSRGEGLVPVRPLTVVKVHRMSWPSGMDVAAAPPDGEAGSVGDAADPDEDRRTHDVSMRDIDSSAQVSAGADADAPWPGLPGCALA